MVQWSGISHGIISQMNVLPLRKSTTFTELWILELTYNALVNADPTYLSVDLEGRQKEISSVSTGYYVNVHSTPLSTSADLRAVMGRMLCGVSEKPYQDSYSDSTQLSGAKP